MLLKEEGNRRMFVTPEKYYVKEKGPGKEL